MTILKVNTNSKQAKALIELVKTFDFVTIIETESEDSFIVEETVELEYNQKFVETVLHSFKYDKDQNLNLLNYGKVYNDNY